MSEYFEELVSESFDVADISATEEQIKTVAGWVKRGFECHDRDHGYECIPNPETQERTRLERELKMERELVFCVTCQGSGRLQYNSGPWAVNTECDECNGKGKKKP